MAPEVMEQTQPYDEKADIWSFGITALELAKGYAPYARLQPMKMLRMTIQNPPPSLKSYEDYQATKNKYSRHFREIITLCLQKVPANRPSASTLLQKTFFKKAPDNAFLVKDLLEAVPIPDTSETSGQVDKEQHKLLEQIQMEQLEEALKQQARDDGSAAAEASAAAAGAAGSPAARLENINADSVRDTLGNLRTHEVLSKLESATIGRSFVKGSTWVFDEDDSAQPVVPPQAPQGQPHRAAPAASAGDTSGFDDFAKEYAMMDITRE
jgi:serine/threonine-protein kinase OSR1/STK39